MVLFLLCLKYLTKKKKKEGRWVLISVDSLNVVFAQGCCATELVLEISLKVSKYINIKSPAEPGHAIGNRSTLTLGGRVREMGNIFSISHSLHMVPSKKIMVGSD